MSETELRQKILEAIQEQGFKINPHVRPVEHNKATYRKIQQKSKTEQINLHKNFLFKNTEIVSKYFINGSELNPANISLELRPVKPDSIEEILFKWWNLIWWSVPYQRAYGRQMRFVIWDKGHNAPFGLIGLQSPVLKMSVRDQALEIPRDELDIWVNQSLQAQRLGALPPYNDLVGGKMAALALTSNEIRNHYTERYKDKVSILKKRVIAPRLLFITTTSAFGKSSIYNRLKYNDHLVAQSLGYTQGYGSFHIPEDLFQELMQFLKNKGIDVRRHFGHGASRRIKLLGIAFRHLGLPDYSSHNVKREFYLFPLADNLKSVIKEKKKPDFFDRPFDELFHFWRNRWCLPRAERNNNWCKFDSEEYLDQVISLYGVS